MAELTAEAALDRVLQKGNDHHDALGRFAEAAGSGGGDVGGSQAWRDQAHLTAEDMQKLPSTLSAEEVQTLQDYKFNGLAIGVNESLRGREVDPAWGFTPKQVHAAIPALDSAVGKGSIAERTLVYRSVPREAFPDGKVVGTTLRDKGFMSTSREQGPTESYASHGGAVLRITLPPGTVGIETGGLDKEIMLPRGAALKVWGATMSGEKITGYDAEYIPPKARVRKGHEVVLGGLILARRNPASG